MNGRGLALGCLAGAAMWALIGIAVVQIFGGGR